MLFQTNRHNRHKSKPQLLTNGSISLLPPSATRELDQKKKATCAAAPPKSEAQPDNQKQVPPPPTTAKTSSNNNNDDDEYEFHPLKRQPVVISLPPPPPSKEKTITTTDIDKKEHSPSSSRRPSISSSCSVSSSKSTSPKRRHVRFHSVELQEYAVTVGDHPLCKGYFPLTLDWSHSKKKEFRINDFERQRLRDRSPALQELHMDVHERWERLRLVTGLPQSTLAHLEMSRHHGCAAA